MPQPQTFKQRDGTTWNALTLQERPECALGVADVASTWAFLEFWLGEMFMSATGDVERDENGSIHTVGHPLAVASLGALESLTAKLDVIAAGIEAMLPDMSAAFEELRIGIRACAKGRNRIVHAVWGINQRYPNDVIRIVMFTNEYIKYTPRDFRDTVERTLIQIEKVRKFDQACALKWREQLPPEPGAKAR